MRLGSFALLIPEGIEGGEGYVRLEHNRQYSLRLANYCHSQRCDADVSIDGKPMGGYRINAGCTITLERSSFDQGRFTFFRADTEAASLAGVDKIATSERGLVRVTFRPERKLAPPSYPSYRTASSSNSVLRSAPKGRSAPIRAMGLCGQSMTAGITGLTGKSDQSFVEVSNLDYDPAGETTITLRLVADAFTPRELVAAPHSNPVPAPVQ